MGHAIPPGEKLKSGIAYSEQLFDVGTMLKVRIIPTLLWKNVGLVKGTQFGSDRRVGPILPAIKVYDRREVDEMVVFDVMATADNEPPDTEMVADFSKDCFVPLTVGGGVTKVEHVQGLLAAGADKVCVNSQAYQDPQLITQIAKRHGEQCVVASIDVRGDAGTGWTCFSRAGAKNEDREVTAWAREVEDRGAGEIIITSIERDGMMNGYDIELIQKVVDAVDIQVVASGGAGTYQHMVEGVLDGGASAVAAASIYHFTEQTPAGARAALQAAGIPVRTTFKG